MNKYLNDSDSSFDEFESVKSDQIQHYESKYKSMMRDPNIRKKKPVKFTLGFRSSTKMQQSH